MTNYLYLKDKNFKTLLKTEMGLENIKEYCKVVMLTHDLLFICDNKQQVIWEVSKKRGRIVFIEKTNTEKEKEKKDKSNMDYVIKEEDNNLIIEVSTDELSRKVDELLSDISSPRIKKTWQSQYNDYVVYDHEPFCSEGFNRVTTVTINDDIIRKYYQYRINEKLQRINKLEKLLLLEASK